MHFDFTFLIFTFILLLFLIFYFNFDIKTSIFGCLFLDVLNECVFYNFHNKFACFVIYENRFLFFTCFKRVDFLEAGCPILFFVVVLLF